METRLILFLLLLCAEFDHQVKAWHCSSCEVAYKAKGCFQDSPNRVLKEQVLNERDKTSKVYGGRMINWRDWNNYMQGFACRCAKIVKEKGYKVFGLQFYGECWSGQPGSYNLKTVMTKESCISDNYAKCNRFDRHCVGQQWTNFVYELESDCGLDFERLGCFRDNKQEPRPIPSYMMTDREPRLKIYSGQSIDWRNWDVYLPEFVCRCAKLAKLKGHSTFGVQYYGECWSGLHSQDTYDKLGFSNNCVDHCFEKCRPFEKFCSGKNFANAVYRLSDAPCEISYQAVGCYGEDSSNRAFAEELLNQIDPADQKFNGVMMEYGDNWQREFAKFLCRCAREAHHKGYTMFGVHEHGECWSDANAEQKYIKYGSSKKCFQNYNQTCPQGSSPCAGGADANFVYRIDARNRRSGIEKNDVSYVLNKDFRLSSLLTEAAAEALARKREITPASQ